MVGWTLTASSVTGLCCCHCRSTYQVTFPYVMGWRLLRWCSVWSSCGVPDGVGHPMLWSSRRGLLEAQVTFPYVMGWRLLRWCSVWSSCGVPDGVGHPMLWSSRRGLLEAQVRSLLWCY
ncbi:uncharacterized protein LOC143808394 isoform X2 [Ranitomeya variabilis]|uniref:uncharacterized protein LOC143808394 isoform X2 n=1 Tax=Ranitomeya variabilis TaxID=490064 RepID=UPI004055E433